MTTTQGKQLKVKRVRVETRDRVEEPVRVEEEKIEKTRIPVGRIIGIGVTIAALAAAVALNQAPSAPPVQAPLPNTAPSQAHLPDTANIPDTMGNPDPRGLGDPLPQQQPPRQPPQQPPRDQGPSNLERIPASMTSLDIVFLVDRSGSMHEATPDGRQKWDALLYDMSIVLNEILTPDLEHRVMFMVFNNTLEVKVPFTRWSGGNGIEIRSMLLKLFPEGNTALWDCLVESLEIVDRESVSQRGVLLVLMSDGGDTTSINHDYYSMWSRFLNINIEREERSMAPIRIVTVSYQDSFYVDDQGRSRKISNPLMQKLGDMGGGGYLEREEIRELKYLILQ